MYYYNYDNELEVKKDGKFTTYDKDLNILEETDVTKRFPTFNYADIEQNGNIITVNSDDKSSYDYDEEYVSVSVNVEIEPVWENSNIEVSLYNDYYSDFDFELDVLEEYYDEAMEYSVTTSSRYKYLLDSKYKPHDVSEYKKVVENVNHDIVILQKEDNHLEYVNFADAQDKKDLSPYIKLSPVNDYNQNDSYRSEQIGYCLITEDSFVITDMNFNPLNEPVKGTPSGIEIKCNDNVYSGSVKFYVNDETDENGKKIIKYGAMSLGKGIIVPTEYDSISIGYGGYLVTKEGMTFVIDENGEAIKEFEGAYQFNFMTGCVYDANWNLTKRVDNVTSSIVYNIEDDEIKYQQTGIYDKVSYFVDDYATVVKYSENNNNNNQDELWSSSPKSSLGIIRIDGTEVVKPSDKLHITMMPDFSDGDTSFMVYADSSTEGKRESSVVLSVKELDTGYINDHDMTVAKMISDNRYIALIDGLWGVYDGNGKEVIKAQFDSFVPFNENGLSIVQTPEYNTCYKYNSYYQDYEKEVIYKTGVIDIEGNIIVEPFNNITENGMKVDNTKYSITPYALKTVLLDKYGVQVCKLVDGKPKYMTITREDVLNDFAKANNYDIARKEGNLYYVEKDGLSGVVSENNEVLVPVEYFDVLSFSPSEINFKFVRPEFQGILENEFSSKINEMSDDSKIVYVKTLNDKVGVYKLIESEGILGDINADGKITIDDAILLKEYLTEGTNTDIQEKSADINGDGDVTVADFKELCQMIAESTNREFEDVYAEVNTEPVTTTSSSTSTTVTTTSVSAEISETTDISTSITTVLSTVTTETTTDITEILAGDANKDGKLNVRDAAFIASKLAQSKASELPASADFNGDGKVNVRDAAAIAKYLAGSKK